MNLLTCFVRTTQRDLIINILSEYSGIQTVIKDAPVTGPIREVLIDVLRPPSLYIVNGNSEWIVIEVNSLMKLYELGSIISRRLDTVFLQTIYCQAIGYACFILYEKGGLMREVESVGCKEIPDVNRGRLLEFEYEGDVSYFDLDMIVSYCQDLGIDVGNIYDQQSCTVLQQAGVLPMVNLDQEQELCRLFFPKG